MNCSYKPEMCPSDLYLLHKLSYRKASDDTDGIPGALEDTLTVVGPTAVGHNFRLLAGNKVLALGVTVEDELFRIQPDGDSLKFTKWGSVFPSGFNPRYISFMNAGDGISIIMDNGVSFVAAPGQIKYCKPED